MIDRGQPARYELLLCDIAHTNYVGAGGGNWPPLEKGFARARRGQVMELAGFMIQVVH